MTDFRVRCEEQQINVRFFNDERDNAGGGSAQFVGISIDETTLGTFDPLIFKIIDA